MHPPPPPSLGRVVAVMDGDGVALAVGVVVAVGVAVRVTVGVAVGDGDGVVVGVGVGVTVTGSGPDEFASKAPMEQFVAPSPGRAKPRWSRLLTGAVPVVVEQTLSSPALIAGLAPVHPALGAPVPVQRAMVCVGPPLFAKPAGSSWGSVLQNEVLLVLVQPVPEKPHVAPSSMLCPPSVIVPLQLPPEVLLAMIVLMKVAGPQMPPPASLALLPEKVLLVTVTVPSWIRMAPPLPPQGTPAQEPRWALLPEKVLLVTVSVPLRMLRMPPPSNAVLPEKVLLVTVPVPPSLLIPPPPFALLPVKVLLMTVSVPSL